MKPKPPEVLCAHCRESQPDNGTRQTCIKCGTFPLPSFAYSPSSSFYPLNCKGIPTAQLAKLSRLPREGDPSILDHINSLKD